MATIYGSNSGETLSGGTGADLIYGYGGNDTLYGNAGGDYINGGRGDDTMYGGDGNDVFEIGGTGSQNAGGLTNGWDNFDGGTGNDIIRILPTSGYAWTAIQINSMTGIEGIQNNSGGPGYVYFHGNLDLSPITSMYGIDTIYGDANANTFNGSAFNENVEGGGGNDILKGNAGDDTLNGGAGTNTLWGGAGADLFKFNTASAVDTIKDYTGGTDHISISTALATDYSALVIADNASGFAEIHAGTTVITLEGVSAATLTSSDFLFF